MLERLFFLLVFHDLIKAETVCEDSIMYKHTVHPSTLSWVAFPSPGRSSLEEPLSPKSTAPGYDNFQPFRREMLWTSERGVREGGGHKSPASHQSVCARPEHAGVHSSCRNVKNRRSQCIFQNAAKDLCSDSTWGKMIQTSGKCALCLPRKKNVKTPEQETWTLTLIWSPTHGLNHLFQIFSVQMKVPSRVSSAPQQTVDKKLKSWLSHRAPPQALLPQGKTGVGSSHLLRAADLGR